MSTHYRYKLIRTVDDTDPYKDVFKILDQVRNRYLEPGEIQKKAPFRQRTPAEAAVEELNESWGPIMENEIHPEACLDNQLSNREKDPFQVTIDQNDTVMKALAGKIKCSGCDFGYYGADPKTSGIPGIKIKHLRAAPNKYQKEPRQETHGAVFTQYSEAKLMVDLECMKCGHSGVYQFNGNPLSTAGSGS